MEEIFVLQGRKTNGGVSLREPDLSIGRVGIVFIFLKKNSWFRYPV